MASIFFSSKLKVTSLRIVSLEALLLNVVLLAMNFVASFQVAECPPFSLACAG